MKAKAALKLILLGALIVALFNLLRGHDVLTGVALSLLLLLTAAKITFTLVMRRRGGSFGDTGSPPIPPAPVLVPVPARPRGAPPEIPCHRDF